MSTVKSLFDSFGVMIAGILISIMLMATLGQIADRVISVLIDIGMLEVNPDWAGTFGPVYTFQTFVFFLCCLPGLYGVLNFILASVRKQQYDTQAEPQIDYTQQYGGLQ